MITCVHAIISCNTNDKWCAHIIQSTSTSSWHSATKSSSTHRRVQAHQRFHQRCRANRSGDVTRVCRLIYCHHLTYGLLTDPDLRLHMLTAWKHLTLDPKIKQTQAISSVKQCGHHPKSIAPSKITILLKSLFIAQTENTVKPCGHHPQPIASNERQTQNTHTNQTQL